MRSTHQKQWLSSEKPTAQSSMDCEHGKASSAASAASKSKGRHGASTERDQKEPPTEVRIRNSAPPDPELLSKIGCRCMVIDLPGVLHQDISAHYRNGFVRVEGKRTVGKIKSFRKKFPINHDQVMTKMLSAYLCQGVLIIVAPTKVAASMAAAFMIASKLMTKGCSFETPPTTPPSSKPLLLLTQYPASFPEEPVKFTKDIRATTPNEVIDCRAKSAFQPYVAAKNLPFDETSEPLSEVNLMTEEPSEETKQAAEEPPTRTTDAPAGLLDLDFKKTEDAGSPPHISPEKANNKGATPLEEPLIKEAPVVLPEEIGSAPEGPSDEMDIANIAEEPVTLDAYVSKYTDVEKNVVLSSSPDLSSLGEQKEPVAWSDDSLREEPSIRAAAARRRIKAHNHIIWHDPDPTGHDLSPQLSPIPEQPHMEHILEESPDLSQSSGRPLTWVQFETLWHESDKEESLMVDTPDNHNRISRLHEERGRVQKPGTAARVGVPIMLPLEDELVDRDVNDFRIGIAPCPDWRTSPLLPRVANCNAHLNPISHGVEKRGPALPHREHYQHREQLTPPSPSLRRKESPTSVGSRRKSVTWVDEI